METKTYVLRPDADSRSVNIQAHAYEVVVTPNTYPFIQFWKSAQRPDLADALYGLGRGWSLCHTDSSDDDVVALQIEAFVRSTKMSLATIKEIAAGLGMNEEAVESCLFNHRRFLRLGSDANAKWGITAHRW